MKYLKKFKNYGLSLSITQLMGLLVMFNIASCSKCSPESPNESKLTIQVDQDKIQDKEKAAIIFGNSGDKDGPVIMLTQYTLKATISNEQGGTDSKIVYTDQQGAQKMEPTIDAPLTDLIEANRTELAGQDTQTINLGIAPGTSVTELAINLEIFEAGNAKPIHTATISWSPVPQALPGKLSLVDITPAVGNEDGQFSVQAIDGDVDPTKVEISWTSQDGTIFQVGGAKSPGETIMLAKVLGNNDIIEKGATAGPITFNVEEDKGQKKATILVSFQRAGDDIGTGIIKWSKEKPKYNLDLAVYNLDLAVSYDEDSKKVTYTIKNNGEAINEKIKLEIHNATEPGVWGQLTAFVNKKTKKGHTMKLDKLAEMAEEQGEVTLEFNKKPSIDVEFILKVKKEEQLRKVLTCKNPAPVKLKFIQTMQYQNIKMNFDTTVKVCKTEQHVVSIKNIGEVAINSKSLKIKYTLPSKEKGKWSVAEDKLLQPGDELTITLDPFQWDEKEEASKKNKTIHLELEYNGQEVKDGSTYLISKSSGA